MKGQFDDVEEIDVFVKCKIITVEVGIGPEVSRKLRPPGSRQSAREIHRDLHECCVQLLFIICANKCSYVRYKIILYMLQHISVLLHYLQGAYILY
jgi:hypothetical protein